VNEDQQMFEKSFPDVNLKKNKTGGYVDGVTSTLWEGWQRRTQALPTLRDLSDPRPADDEPRLCSNNRQMWRMGFNAALGKSI